MTRSYLLVTMMVTGAAASACVDAPDPAAQDPGLDRAQILACSSVGVMTPEEVRQAPPWTPVKVAGRIGAAAPSCAADCGQACCTCLTTPVLEGTDLPLGWGAISPSFCDVDSCGGALCWPFRHREVEYWIWGPARETGGMMAAGFCIQTTAEGLRGDYEGDVTVAGAGGARRPRLRLTVTDDDRWLLDSEGGCTGCQGPVAPQEASNVVLGDGTVELSFVVEDRLDDRGERAVRVALQSRYGCLSGDNGGSDGDGGDVSISLCRE